MSGCLQRTGFIRKFIIPNRKEVLCNGKICRL